MPKKPEQCISELKAKVKLLEKQKFLLEYKSLITNQKVLIYNIVSHFEHHVFEQNSFHSICIILFKTFHLAQT